MSDLSNKKVSRRKFLKIGGVVGGSLLLTSIPSMGGKRKKAIRFLNTEATPSSKEFFKGTSARFTKETAIPVEIEYVSLNPEEKLATYIRAGTPPELSILGPNTGAHLALKGVLEPVDDLIEWVENRYNFKYPEAFLTGKVRGENYFLPVWCNVNTDWYREDLYQKHGLGSPETWDMLLEASSAINNPPGIYGISVPAATTPMSSTFLWEYLWTNEAKVAGRPEGPSGEVDVVLDKGENFERAIETVKFLKKLYEYSPVTSNYNWAEQIEVYWTGRVAEAKYGGSRPKLQAIAQNPKIAPVTKPVISPYKRKQVSVNIPEGFCIFKGSKNPDAAKEWIKFLLDRKRYVAMCLATAPVHNLPAIPKVLKSNEFTNSDFVKRNFTKEELDVLMDNLNKSLPYMMETNPPHPFAGVLFETYELGNILFRSLEKRDEPSEVIKESCINMRKALQEAKTSIGKI